MIMRSFLFSLLLFVPLLLSAQCPGAPHSTTGELPPTLRALLMMERPATMSVEQWKKIIENPGNWIDLPVKVYEEETIDLCELPSSIWCFILPGRRPPEKDPYLLPSTDSKP